jgi:hypothetical protein
MFSEGSPVSVDCTWVEDHRQAGTRGRFRSVYVAHFSRALYLVVIGQLRGEGEDARAWSSLRRCMFSEGSPVSVDCTWVED